MLWLKIVRILDVLGIIASLVVINTDGSNKWLYGSILIIQIFALLFLNAKINSVNDIQAKKRVVKILDNLLDEMKEEGVDNLKDLKRNQKQ